MICRISLAERPPAGRVAPGVAAAGMAPRAGTARGAWMVMFMGAFFLLGDAARGTAPRVMRQGPARCARLGRKGLQALRRLVADILPC